MCPNELYVKGSNKSVSPTRSGTTSKGTDSIRGLSGLLAKSQSTDLSDTTISVLVINLWTKTFSQRKDKATCFFLKSTWTWKFWLTNIKLPLYSLLEFLPVNTLQVGAMGVQSTVWLLIHTWLNTFLENMNNCKCLLTWKTAKSAYFSAWERNFPFHKQCRPLKLSRNHWPSVGLSQISFLNSF